MNFISKSTYLIALIFICSSVFKLQAQLGFCNGNSGDPIFEETFDTGIINGPQLPAGTTTYNFTTSTPDDGDYTISSSTNYFDWHDTQDHTPNDTNGKSLIVNADFTAGEFYRTTISGLCQNTSYEFSSWLINLLPSSGCGGGGIPINVRFEIWDNTDTNLLASGDTGNIGASETPAWQEHGLVFQTLSNQTSVILKMINNGVGGCGNDLAIDDIVFKTCGDLITITNSQNESNIFICEGEPSFSTTLTAAPDFSIFATHFYQWQQGIDGINWVDILGETNQSFTTPLLTNNTFYRVKVAEDTINLSNPLCNSLSEVFEFDIITLPDAPLSNGNIIVCENSNELLIVTVPDGITVNWYDEPVGGNLLLSGSASYKSFVSGTFYAEAVTINGGCLSLLRTALQIDVIQLPRVFDEALTFCKNEEITLFSNAVNVTYLWNTGAITSEITVNKQGVYTVEVTNIGDCTSLKTITLTQIDIPIIESVISDGSSIIVRTLNSGYFEYSLDGISYQTSNVFLDVEGGKYTIYVREISGCGIVSQAILHFVIPKFFTPNEDNKNDTFALKGIDHFSSSEVFIFDRFGKLIKSSKNSIFTWDGTFNNSPLPTSDYWYFIRIDSAEFRGHFTLKR